MERITIRLDNELLNSIDSYIDYISIKNRSDAIRYLLKKSIIKDRIAVIISKGSDLPNQDLMSDISIGPNDFGLISPFNDTCLIKEQIRRLSKYGFNIIYIITLPEVIEAIKSKGILHEFDNLIIYYISNNDALQTGDALRLLNGRIHSEFLMIYSDILFDMNIAKMYGEFMNSNTLCSMAVTYSDEASIKGWVAIEGNQIVNFLEKTEVAQKSIVAEPIFMMDPEIFEIPGHSFPYDILPKLAKEKKLGGYTTSSPIIHLHRNEDKKKFAIFFK